MSAGDTSGTTIEGGSDGTTVGNTGDRLKVDATFSSSTTTVPSWSKKLRYDDMNVSTGGIARDTSLSGGTWTTVYLYNGSGYLAGILMNVESWKDWEFRLIVDTETIFTLKADDIQNDKIYDLDDIDDVNQAFLGVSKGSHDRFLWHPPFSSSLYYASNVTVQARKIGGAKKFQAGLVVLSKET